jgi:hypothetical protein
VREQVATLLQVDSPARALDSASKAYAGGDYRKAINFSEKYSTHSSEHQHSLALLTARAYAKLGDVDKTVQYLRIAESVSQINRQNFMTDPAFAEIATEIEFVKFIASNSENHAARSNTAPRTARQPGVAASAGSDTSTHIGPQSTSATAGGVSVTISNGVAASAGSGTSTHIGPQSTSATAGGVSVTISK